MKQQLIDFYLDWTNNYLAPSKMAEDYGLRPSEVVTLLEMGRIYHEKSVKKNKI